MCDRCLGLLATNDQLEAQVIDLRVEKQVAEAKVAVYEEMAEDLIKELKQARAVFTPGL